MKLVEINRKINIYTWIFFIVLILAISIVLLATYKNKNKTSYLYYNENANIDYKVELKENKYFDENFLGKDNQYISSLIDGVVANFNYKLDICDDSEYTYKYKIVANINITDKDTNKILYKSSKELVPEKIGTQKGKLNLKENVNINYNEYNDFANEFVSVYNLKKGISKLSTIMYIKLEGINKNEDSTVTLDIPLNENTFSINSSTNLGANNENYIEVKTSKNGTILLNGAILLVVIDVLLLLGLIKYIKDSQTDEEVYNSQLKKILNKYESCISKVEEEFNMSEYRIIKMQSFVDLLEIRDTMRLPIIMFENKDKLMACFMITTDNNVLYFFSIGVTQYALPESKENRENEEYEENEECIKVEQKNEN